MQAAAACDCFRLPLLTVTLAANCILCVVAAVGLTLGKHDGAAQARTYTTTLTYDAACFPPNGQAVSRPVGGATQCGISR